jgi:hypothetical protein
MRCDPAAVVAQVAARWAGALADLRDQGLPPARKLRCCGSWCRLQLLLGSPDATMEIATEAKRLKEECRHSLGQGHLPLFTPRVYR